MKKIILSLIIAAFAVHANAQTPTATKNYVVETMVKISGKKDTASLNGLTVSQANRNIQYFDGLGRPIQTVQWKASPAGKDIVQVMEYDALGRQLTQYQPYAEQSSTDGGYKTSALTNQGNFYNSNPLTSWDVNSMKTPYPYSKIVTDGSPLQRPVEQGAPGDAWQPYSAGIAGSGHTVKMSYGTNDLNEVQIWTITGTGAETVANYTANMLNKTTTKDENWTSGKIGTVEEFKDMQGNVVLKRIWETNLISLSTYYVYDIYNNLRYVIPPGVNTGSTTTFTEASTVFTDFIYGYHYDQRKRLIEKKIPGKGWEHMVYNNLDQVVMTQDYMQRAGNRWLFTKYDVHGRVVLTGLVNSSDTRSTWQTSFDAQTANWESRDNANASAAGTGYTNSSLPLHASISQYYTVNYYDDYSIYNLPTRAAYNKGSSFSPRLRGLQTVGKKNILNTAHFLWNVNYYDSDGRAVNTVQHHYQGTTMNTGNYDETIYHYNFVNQVDTVIRKHYILSVANLYVKNTVNYDHAGRSIDTYQLTGKSDATTANTPVLLSRKAYNELGQLKNKKLHSTDNGINFKQDVAYAYNERGWLTSQAAALFSQSLKYQSVGGLGLTPNYNGNITRQEWGSGKYYNYSYDALNRLTSAISDAHNDETLAYDKMGNIVSLERKYNSNIKDQLTYTYTNGNQLASVHDANADADDAYQSSGTTNYVYDGNGNMRDRTNTVKTANNLIAFTYNNLNLPNSVVTIGAVYSYFIYDGQGNKLRKTFGSSVANDYISGIQYENNELVFVQTSEGRAVKNGSGADPVYNYEYTLTDHLGNGRVYFNILAGAANPIQSQDYYAFGMAIQSGTLSGTENKYQYNGKEKQDEVKMLDYGARFYDAVIGRWNGVDPLALGRVEMTPYHYVSNNPINKIDPDGRWDWYQSDATGTVKWFEGSGEQDGFKHIGVQGTVTSYGENAGIINLNSDGSATNAATGDKATYSTSGKTRIVEKDNTSEGYKMFLDILSGGAYSRESRAIDILDRDGLKAYNYQKIADAHSEIRQEWMGGAYHVGTAIGTNSAKGIGRIQAGSLKEFKSLIQNLSKPSSQLTKAELQQFEKLTEQFGGKLRYDLNPIKGKILQPHVQVEGLGTSVGSRHIWLGQ